MRGDSSQALPLAGPAGASVLVTCRVPRRAATGAFGCRPLSDAPLRAPCGFSLRGPAATGRLCGASLRLTLPSPPPCPCPRCPWTTLRLVLPTPSAQLSASGPGSVLDASLSTPSPAPFPALNVLGVSRGLFHPLCLVSDASLLTWVTAVALIPRSSPTPALTQERGRPPRVARRAL